MDKYKKKRYGYVTRTGAVYKIKVKLVSVEGTKEKIITWTKKVESLDKLRSQLARKFKEQDMLLSDLEIVEKKAGLFGISEEKFYTTAEFLESE